MWDIIRGHVASEPGIDHDRLMARLMGMADREWPARVLANPSKQVVGSEKWCRGYLNGAVREGYLTRT
jgi:hypothetical protein